MKVIDLLNRIANSEELPKKIKYRNNIYILIDNHCYFCDETNLILSDNLFAEQSILNEEIEIIKDKTLEDILTPDELKCFEDVKELVTRLSDEDVKILVKLLFGDKYDEIMDELKGE